jgi:B-cell receptor-associated protein 31
MIYLDSIRELRKYSAVEVKDLSTPQAEAHAHMKQFRSQRNFYIAGFALFLWLYVEKLLLSWIKILIRSFFSVIKRLINLLSEVAREMADSAAARKQAEGAHRHLEGLATNDPAVRFRFLH